MAVGASAEVWGLHYLVILSVVSAFNSVINVAKQTNQSWKLFWAINVLLALLTSAIFYINDLFRRKGWLVGRIQGRWKLGQASFNQIGSSAHNPQHEMNLT